MAIDEVIQLVLVPVAYGIALAATALMCLYVRRRYPTAPKRVPLRIRWDGRPSGEGPRGWLWLAPAAMVLILAVLTALLIVAPPRAGDRVLIALVFVIVAEVAWFTAWTTDRQIELARRMTYRIAPARTLRAALPMLLTIALTLFLALRPS